MVGYHVCSAVRAWLNALVDAELVQLHSSSRFAHEAENCFRHALVRDAAYSLLRADDLTTGHRAGGVFLEAVGETDAAVIAEHFERSGDKPRAASSYLRAAENSLDRGNNHGTLRQVERGLLCDPSFETVGQFRSVESLALLWLNRYECEIRPIVTARSA